MIRPATTQQQEETSRVAKNSTTTTTTTTITTEVRTAGTATTTAATIDASSSSMTTAKPPTITSCPICYEDFGEVMADASANSDGNKLETIHPCLHVCCRDCLYEHCQYCISLHKVPIGCPQHLLLHDENQGNHSNNKNNKHLRNFIPKPKKGAAPPPPPTNTSQCTAILSHALVHDVVCLCRIDIVADNHDETNADDNKLNERDEEKKETDEAQKQQQLQNSVYVVCRKNDPLWNKYVTCCEKKNQPPQEFQPPLPPLLLPNPLSVSRHSNSDDSFATACADDDDTDSSPSTPQNVRGDTNKPVVVAINNDQQTATATTTTDKNKNNTTDNHNSTSSTLQEQEMLSRRVMQSLQIKPCSHCSMPLNKTGGCDHIVCPACHQDMCYKCGTHRYLNGQGYIRSCMGCQQDYIDHRHLPRNGFMFWCVYAPCCVLPIILLFPFIFIFQCCMYCCCTTTESDGGGSGTGKNDNDELAATIQMGSSLPTQRGQHDHSNNEGDLDDNV